MILGSASIQHEDVRSRDVDACLVKQVPGTIGQCHLGEPFRASIESSLVSFLSQDDFFSVAGW